MMMANEQFKNFLNYSRIVNYQTTQRCVWEHCEIVDSAGNLKITDEPRARHVMVFIMVLDIN